MNLVGEALASSRLDGETRVIEPEVQRIVSDRDLLALHARTTPGEWSAAPEPECRDEEPQNQWWWVTGDKDWPPITDDYPLESNCTFIAVAHNELPLILREKASLAEQLGAANGIISALAQLLGAKIETLPSISDRVHQLHARVRELTEWRPMETAPKDGTEVLLAIGCVSRAAGPPKRTKLVARWDGTLWSENKSDGEEKHYGATFDGWLPLPEVTS